MQSAGTGAAARTVPVRYTAGVVLDVPAGALNQPTVFDVTDIACPAADVVLGRARYATHQERCLGGFDARPDGLWFAVPVTATIPVLPLDPFEFPMQGVVDLAAETSSLLATDLTYRGDAHVLAPTQGGGCSVSTASVSASVSQRVRIADVGWNPFVGWIFSCSGKFTTPGAGGAVWRGDREASATDGPRPAGAGPAR